MSGHQIAQRLQQLRSVYAFSSTVILESLTTGIDAVSETLVPISRDDIFIKKHDEAADTDAKNEVGNEEDEGEIATGPSPGRFRFDSVCDWTVMMMTVEWR